MIFGPCLTLFPVTPQDLYHSPMKTHLSAIISLSQDLAIAGQDRGALV